MKNDFCFVFFFLENAYDKRMMKRFFFVFFENAMQKTMRKRMTNPPTLKFDCVPTVNPYAEGKEIDRYIHEDEIITFHNTLENILSKNK